ncbi:DUF2306 domain-containing protein [Maribacter sp. HTCC2170]|uniref:DUF2306 domain-containing protein n=1 Tax=Maribacter sp. (strain HTCC2170 / KCCM 42371) TaxID=313603 RepID=UPI00006BD2D3|nr:DUF2306 domain-containing protein [Maribacter sp. HTCC2170]EAR02074.1 hypothetical protein FB2170_02285 [Maribacter sp. HTCC2170]
MKNKSNKVSWLVFVVLAVAVGLYPLIYFFIDRQFGLLGSKSPELLANTLWNIGFYGHILLGGLALFIGWAQFSKKLRKVNLKMHRNVGKLYIISVLISGICGVYIAFYATGGIIASLGFICLGLLWLFTTIKAYTAVRNKDITLHKGFMIYSYAACFAAVTLRIWLPILNIIFEDFAIAYRIVAWLCWVPNMIFAFFWVRKRGFAIG